ncbi:MAG: RluA family pseudouridine synthase [Bacteroidia bacterium]|nr:RluA family pseudouridine synthase [Bacteroidia bacterium]MDW8159034.1 RluA family pseudouridine synthase [Bacteroidia bacterium]
MGNRDFRLKKIDFENLIIYEDAELLCINKPAGVSCIRERFLASHLDLLSLSQKYNPNLKLCHRIDKYTSGALLFAKTNNSYCTITYQFRKKEIIKKYWAIVGTAIQLKNVAVNKPIRVGKKGISRIDPINGKKAITIFNTLQQFRHYSLIECQPITGRQHQIRVHLAYLRLPIVGDETYGGKPLFLSQLKRKYKYSKEQEEAALNISYLLHAYSLEFTHPKTGERLLIEAPANRNFQTCLTVLSKYDQLPSTQQIKEFF